MTEIKSESPDVQAEGVQHGSIGRRRLLRAGLAATPVVLAVSGRSAMAATCPTGLSPATMASLDPDGDGTCIEFSHHTLSSNALGKSPDYWTPIAGSQTFLSPYPWPVAPFDSIKTTEDKTYYWSPDNYLTYQNIASNAAGWATGATYKDIFAGADSRSFSRILLDDKTSVAAYLCAAYLNAAAMPGTYAMTTAEVIFLAVEGHLVPGGNLLTDGQIRAFLSQTWA